MKAGIFLAVGLLAVARAAGDYNPEWVNKIRLPISMINKIFGLITLDPLAPDNS